jgi:large subunit ribosomal protein L10
VLKAEKERIVAELAEKLKATPTLFVADYRGLSVTEIDDLRTKLIEHGARFTVVKNTLTKRAAEEAGAESLLALLEGPTAIAFIEADGDMVAVAKALTDSARTTRILAIRGGILDGSPIGEEQVRNLATLPPLDVLRGQVLGAITAPLVTVVGLISAPVRDLLGLIDARIEQLEAQGDTSAAVSDTPAEASEGAEQVSDTTEPVVADQAQGETSAAVSDTPAEASEGAEQVSDTTEPVVADQAQGDTSAAVSDTPAEASEGAEQVSDTTEPASEAATEDPTAEAETADEPVAAKPENEAPVSDESAAAEPAATDEAATEQPSKEE